VTAHLTITPRGPLRGTISVSGDKSITHRAIIFSALGDGPTTILDDCRGEDCVNTARAMRAMGISVDEQADRLVVTGKGLWGLSEPAAPLDCGNSGTGIRLLTGLLAGQDFFSILTGDESVRRRPMGRVVTPLREMGAVIAGRRGGELAPLAVTGSKLHGIQYRSPVASAQVKSSLLLAGLFADGVTSVTEPQLSRDHTERMSAFFGVPLRRSGLTVSVTGRPAGGWQGRGLLRVPGDLSAAAFFLVGASIVPGSDVTLTGVGVNPTRAGVLEILKAMGADIQLLNQREEAGEPVADLRVRASRLRATAIGPALIPPAIDELPILCVAAATADGETVISGAQELRVKESDRIATMAMELAKFGVSLSERPDGLVIHGSEASARTHLTGASCDSHGDHRIAMSLAMAGLVADGPSQIHDTECIQTSFPDFSSKLLELLT